jgi:hypothetical protein
MPRLSTLISRMTGMSEPRVPQERLERVNTAFRRRLDDAVEDVFSRACLSGDLQTATELLAVLENMHQRRQVAVGHDRRLSDTTLMRARRELALRQGDAANRANEAA